MNYTFNTQGDKETDNCYMYFVVYVLFFWRIKDIG
jgi:hypothetical protein